jgi:hypothetical protein
MRILLVAIACLAGCFQRASDRFACAFEDDCAEGRTCQNGFCVVGTPDDAAQLIDMAVVVDMPIDARPCTGGDVNATDADGNCFVAFINNNKNRANAETDCVGLNMHLAAVRNDASNDVVQGLVTGKISWLGATDLVAEGTFLWPDGSALAYDNFRSGVPNNGGGQGQEDCLAIEGNNGGSWDDRPCGDSFAYVCGFEN